MSFTAFLLISASIILHSTWNFLCKSSGKPSYAFFALFSTSLFLTMLPFGICSGLLTSIPWDIWKFAICGAVSGSIGNIGLRFAYKYSDISIAYPMARAIPVFLTMFLTMLFGWGAPLTAAATVGMIVIFAGCVIMAFSNNVKDKTWREKLSFLKKGLPGIMIAAVGTTLYTIVDSYGVRRCQSRVSFTYYVYIALQCSSLIYSTRIAYRGFETKILSQLFETHRRSYKF